MFPSFGSGGGAGVRGAQKLLALTQFLCEVAVLQPARGGREVSRTRSFDLKSYLLTLQMISAPQSQRWAPTTGLCGLYQWAGCRELAGRTLDEGTDLAMEEDPSQFLLLFPR
jgi:hypothetical protein